MPLAQNRVEYLRDQVQHMLDAEGKSLGYFQATASELIVFGSRATGLCRPDSDLDLLIVSNQSGHKRIGKLDLIFVPQTKIYSTAWRRTEIAGHISAYGVSLMHDQVRIDPINDDYAAMRKQVRLQKLIRRLLPCWHMLDEGLKIKYLTRIRRELQRYRILKDRLAVPPTATLDSIMDSPSWVNSAFNDLESAAGISTSEAELARQILIKEARIIQRQIRSSNRRSKRAA